MLAETFTVIWCIPSAAWAWAEQEEKKRRKLMLDKIRVVNVVVEPSRRTDAGGEVCAWSFEVQSVEGPLLHEKKDGVDYYNGVSMWQIKLEAERIARAQAVA